MMQVRVYFYSIAPIGGDELLAICEGIDEDTLQKRIAVLRENAAENSVVLAVGSVWEREFQNNLQTLMGEAERLMYEDKSEYYRMTGIDRRR